MTDAIRAEQVTTGTTDVVAAVRERRKREAATTAEDVLAFVADHVSYYWNRDALVYALAIVAKRHAEAVRWSLATGPSPRLARAFRRAEREYGAWQDQGRANVPVHSSSVVAGGDDRRRATGADGFDLEAAA